MCVSVSSSDIAGNGPARHGGTAAALTPKGIAEQILLRPVFARLF
jgi:hypothetical protein